MAAAACKVILCGDPPRAAIDSLQAFAAEVVAGRVTLTPAMETKLLEMAAAMDSANAVLTDGFGKLMQEAFPA
jgi:hypothetical protein